MLGELIRTLQPGKKPHDALQHDIRDVVSVLTLYYHNLIAFAQLVHLFWELHNNLTGQLSRYPSALMECQDKNLILITAVMCLNITKKQKTNKKRVIKWCQNESKALLEKMKMFFRCYLVAFVLIIMYWKSDLKRWTVMKILFRQTKTGHVVEGRDC